MDCRSIWGVSNGERTRAILIDFVLFSCVAAFVTGIVIAAAKLII
jgi:hypothetical protein